MIEELIGHFSPESFSEWCRASFARFTADPHEVPKADDFSKARIVGYVESLPDNDINRPLLVMSVYVGEQIGERSSRRKQFDFARKQLLAAIAKPPAKVKGLFTQGLFAFHDKAGNFRLSLVSSRADGKKLVYSDFKRQSFFVQTGRNNKTFRSRMDSTFDSYGKLAAAFSVETLTKEFYNSLFAWYERAMAPEAKVSFPNDVNSADDDRTQLAEHLIRLITRLMFIWFIRQKNLIPDRIFEPSELKKLLKTFDPASPKQDNYYRAILQNLFFATLNCEIKERDFAKDGSFAENKEHFGIKLLYRYRDEFACTPEAVIELFRGVPFLNGGLFECLDKKTDYQDGFSRNAKRVAHIPNNLFFGEHGLITLFARYDFTVDENDPNDSDVALDPELLGKVFENLLGAYNPETRETARKQSGSFYTPREIVNYMVDESLVAHLRTQVPEVEEPVIRCCLGGEQMPDLSKPLRNKLVTALYHCRILDPACGSGAFPMGLLLKMVHLLQRLDPKNSLWREVVMAETEKALSEAETLDPAEKKHRLQRITESFDQNINQPDYARKLYLIENCIFGVDIQPIAVQIAKLRTFITLVCDQEPDLTDAAHNYRMLPLPNLETKFVAANSLIGLSTDFAEGLKPGEGGSHLDDPELVRLRAELSEVRHQHFRARNSSDKNGCRKRDRDLRGKIKARLVEIACKPDAAKLALYRAEIERLNAKRKSVEREEWKDVIQSEPQQGNLFESSPAPVQTIMHVDVNKEARDRIDDDIRQNTREIEAEESRAKNKSAFQKEADTLAAWDPYDQNASSTFFDHAWMFGFKGGFDIVIGNPPYGIEFDEETKSYIRTNYSSYKYKFESYVYFIEIAIKLASNRGVVCYITPELWLTLENCEPIRRLVANTAAISLLWVCGEDVFAAAVVNTVVSLLQKGKECASTLVRHGSETWHLPTKSWMSSSLLNIEYRLRPETLSLVQKMREISQPLSDFGESVQGITPYDKYRGHTPEQIRKRVFHFREKRDAKCGKWLDGRDVGRYSLTWGGEWLRYGPWLGAPREPRFFQGPRLLFREIPGPSKRIQATAVQEEVLYHGHSITPFRIHESSNGSLYFLLGVLNSRLVSWFAGVTLPNFGKDIFPKLNPQDIKSLPIPQLASRKDGPRIKDVIEDLVASILVAKERDPDTDISPIETQIDRLVYELYGLTDDEIAIVEGRGASEKGTVVPVKPVKVPAARQPRKSVMTEDPDLS